MTTTHPTTRDALPDYCTTYDDPDAPSIGTRPLEPVALEAVDLPRVLDVDVRWRGAWLAFGRRGGDVC